MKIEMEHADEMPSPAAKEPTLYKEETKETRDSAESLSQAMSNLNLEPVAAYRRKAQFEKVRDEKHPGFIKIPLFLHFLSKQTLK